MKAVMVGSSPAAACVVVRTPTDEHSMVATASTDCQVLRSSQRQRKWGGVFLCVLSTLVASIIDPRPDEGGYGRIQSGCGFCGRGNTHRRAQRATESADCEVLNDSENGAAFFLLPIFYLYVS